MAIKYQFRLAFWVVLFGGLAYGLGLFSLAQPGPPTPTKLTKATFLAAVPESVGNKLPTCFRTIKDDAGLDKCIAWLHRVQPQIRTIRYATYDLYLKGLYQTKYQIFHAHGLRIKIGTNWLWMIHGSPIWAKAFKIYIAAHPGLGIQGPYPFSDLKTKPALCAAIAEKMLINVTNDAGALKQPNPVTTRTCAGLPNDAGVDLCTYTTTNPTHPDGSVVQCSSKYYLLRSKLQGIIPVNWDNTLLNDAIEVTAHPGIPARVNVKAWDIPDARVHKTCVKVPVGTACP